MLSTEIGLEELRLFVRALGGTPDAREIVNWGVGRLAAGSPHPAVLELAVLDANHARSADALPLFRRIISAPPFGIERLDDALRRYFSVLLRGVLAGTVQPETAAQCVWDEIIRVGLYQAPYVEFREWYDRCLRAWDLMHGHFELDGSEIPDAEFAGRVRELARVTLADRGCAGGAIGAGRE